MITLECTLFTARSLWNAHSLLRKRVPLLEQPKGLNIKKKKKTSWNSIKYPQTTFMYQKRK